MSSTSSSSHILVVGSVNCDTFIHIHRMPKLGETIESAIPNTGITSPGGKGANQAVACSNLVQNRSHDKISWSIEFCGRFGTDAHGASLQNIMKNEYKCHLTASSVCTENNTPSGQAFIFLDNKTGENSIIICGAANRDWPTELTDHMKKSIETAKLVLIQREISEYVNIQVSKHAKQHNVPVWLDCGGESTQINPELYNYIDLIMPNETELYRLLNPNAHEEQKEFSVDTVITQAKQFQSKYPVKNILVSVGSSGSILLLADGTLLKQSVYPVPEKLIDTTGAGDCFRGALAVARIIENMEWKEALKFASAAASIAITRLGAMKSMPNRDETMKHYEKYSNSA